MTPEQFTYWLQGYMEIENPEKLGKKQTQILKDHLQLVFDKQTPDRSGGLLGIPDIGLKTSPQPVLPGTLDYTITCTDTTSTLDGAKLDLGKLSARIC